KTLNSSLHDSHFCLSKELEILEEKFGPNTREGKKIISFHKALEEEHLNSEYLHMYILVIEMLHLCAAYIAKEKLPDSEHPQ
ncbi:24495_t:CDS:2, partial [Racocetra persica]